MDFFRILIGRRLANEEGQARKITAVEGVPAMGLDGLVSSAYGPEAALTILIPLGAEGVNLIQPIMAAILVLFGTPLLFISTDHRSLSPQRGFVPVEWLADAPAVRSSNAARRTKCLDRHRAVDL
jgi:hypothetical protein